jgi:BirA family biotin operon repressor/biotin-[acetyl-CoA-carboxylase] ligase
LALNVKDFIEAPVISFDTIDSTNNYAMSLIDADKAQNGLTLVTKIQTAGKGQRGNVWKDEPGQSVLMSLILQPEMPVEQQFYFNTAIAVSIAEVLESLETDWQVHIKWPNDIIINDKKAGGILVENTFRGSSWTHSVIGFGLNVLQSSFPAELPRATSLLMSSGKRFDINELVSRLREQMIRNIFAGHITTFLDSYNQRLHRKGQLQQFSDGTEEWAAWILGVNRDGQLVVRFNDGTTAAYTHGTVNWKW